LRHWRLVLSFALAAASPALADQPPGQLGYEGQPGNQGGGGGPAPGLLGYEGQPGNQGGPWKLAFAQPLQAARQTSGRLLWPPLFSHPEAWAPDSPARSRRRDGWRS
jgi:hypothetical protein